MKSRKRAAQFFLSIIAFSIVTSMLPLMSAFADTKTSADTKVETAQLTKEFSKPISAKEVDKSSFAQVLKAADPKATSGSIPIINQLDVNKKLYADLRDNEDSEFGEPEIKALKNLGTTDMCDRNSGNSGGVGHHTYLEYLLFLMGDLKSPSFGAVAAGHDTLATMVVQPEVVPATNYECFPDIWKTKYTDEQWYKLQKSLGTYSCGTLDVACRIEKAARTWISDAIKTGLTWIMNIATGSGSGGSLQACRVGINDEVNVNSYDYRDDPNTAVDAGVQSGFDPTTSAACSKALDDYYAIGSVPSSVDGDYQKMAIGFKAEPKDENGNYDEVNDIGSGASSINNPATTNFFKKSANIGLIIAVGMIVSAVIQAMVQQKPQLLFRSILIQLPLFGIGILAVPILSRNFMAFIDGVSYYMADNSQRDIARISMAIGVNVGNAANEGAAGAAAAYAFIPSIMQASFLILLLIGVIFLLQALGLWALMQFREASIVLVLAAIPLSMSASIWPQLTRTANKFIKLLSSLIVAKIPIVMALSMGLNFIGDWAFNHTGNAAVDTTLAVSDSSGGSRALILGMAIFGVAFLAPTFVITLFDAIGEMGGSLARGLHTAVGTKSLMYASQAAGLKGLGSTFLGKGGAGGGMPKLTGAKSTSSSSKSSTSSSSGGGSTPTPNPKSPPGPPVTSGRTPATQPSTKADPAVKTIPFTNGKPIKGQKLN